MRSYFPIMESGSFPLEIHLDIEDFGSSCIHIKRIFLQLFTQLLLSPCCVCRRHTEIHRYVLVVSRRSLKCHSFSPHHNMPNPEPLKPVSATPVEWLWWKMAMTKAFRNGSPRTNKLDHDAIKFPLIPNQSWRKQKATTHLCHCGFKANKHQIKQAVKKLYDTDKAKINTLIRADGEKSYVRLAPDYDVLDVANKISII